MKFDWKNNQRSLISFGNTSNQTNERKYSEIFQRSLISFENTSYQTNERKYSEDFQLMISVNSDNQTSFQLFYWIKIRE